MSYSHEIELQGEIWVSSINLKRLKQILLTGVSYGPIRNFMYHPAVGRMVSCAQKILEDDRPNCEIFSYTSH